MTSTLQAGASIWAIATRITPLDADGNLIVGDNVFVTTTLVKSTMTEVVEAGDMVAIKNADGNLEVWAKHGDIPKWFTADIELALPDPYLEQVLAGGTVFNDISAALGAPTAPTVTNIDYTTTLPGGSYVYGSTFYNQYGESELSPTTTATLTADEAGWVVPETTLGLGAVIYGRKAGTVQRLGTVPAIGSQATSAASGTGSVSTLSVTALTEPIPIGTTFEITGDTNTPHIIFTVAESGGVGQNVLAVNPVTITTTIATAAIVPGFLDNGSVTPSGLPPTTDHTAGPGNNVGYQLAAMGTVANPNGVAIEFFCRRYIKGIQAQDYPFWRHVWPCVKNLHIMPRDFTNANLQTIFEGDAFPNPNFGTGPDGTWQFDSSEAYQRAVCGAEIVPTPSYAPVTVDV